jgi:hypothetical protein
MSKGWLNAIAETPAQAPDIAIIGHVDIDQGGAEAGRSPETVSSDNIGGLATVFAAIRRSRKAAARRNFRMRIFK